MFNKFDVDNSVKNYDGMAIRTGTQLKDGSYLMALDIDDNKDDTNKLNGLKKWRELLTENNFKNGELSINTPIQQTLNKGFHYLFKISYEQYQKIGNNKLELNINNNKYGIDIICNNGFLLCEPSKLKKML